jgi:protocatechuate 3,4-dioxygenase beta subunit
MKSDRWLGLCLAAIALLTGLAVKADLAAQGRGAPPPPPVGTGQGRGAQPPQQGQQPQKPPPPLTTTGLIVGRVVDAATGRPVAGATVTLQGGVAPARPTPVPPGAPRPTPAPPAQPPRFLTDGEGRFAFRNLTRGSFNVTAQKPGYSDGAYGRFRPGGPSRNIQLDDNERVGEISVRIFKMAVITGTVVDEAGEPVIGALMRAYRRMLQAGRRVLMQSSSVTTDDRGTYRFSNLQPGEYIVSLPIVAASTPAGFTGEGRDLNFQATANTPGSGFFFAGTAGRQVTPDGRFLLHGGSPSGSASLAMVTTPEPTGRVLSYATQYYMGTSSAGQATVIKVASGEERTGADFVMRLVPTTSISGVLLSPEGPASNYVLHLIPGDADTFSFDPDAATAVTDDSGAFMFLGVPAGQYIVQTTRVTEGVFQPPTPPVPPGGNVRTEQTVDASGRTVVTTTVLSSTGQVLTVNRQTVAPPMLWASMPIAVGDAPLDGVALSLREGYKISGRVEFNGSAERVPPARMAQIPISVEPADGRQRTNFQPPGRVAPDGTFTVTGLLPGHYLVRIGGAPGGWMTQSVMLGGVDISDNPVELEKDVTGVLVTFTDRISDLRVSVRGLKDDGEPAAIIVFPSDSAAWKRFGFNPRRMRLVRAIRPGPYSIGTMPAGDYYVVAVPDEYSTEWNDPAYLEVLTRVAMRISIGDGEKKVQEVDVQDVRPPGGGAPLPVALGASSAGEPRETHPNAQARWGPRRSGDHGDSASERVGGCVGAEPPALSPETTPALPQQARDRLLTDPVGKGSISGVVVEEGTNRPVRRARISARTPEMRNEVFGYSEDDGRFVLPRLPGGPYTIVVTKPAYLTGYHGGTRPGRGPGVPVPLKEGQHLTGLTVALARGGVISGVVMDQFGQPYSGGRIRLMQVQRRDGDQILVSSGGSGTMSTDDRGVYRIYGLMPGTYAVGVVPSVPSGSETRALSDTEMRAALADLARKDPQTSAPAATNADGTRQIAPAPPGPPPVVPLAGRSLGLATVYYPGTVIDTDAARIPVAAGQEVAGIDFTLMFVPTARVEGTVVMADGQSMGRSQVQMSSVVAGSTTNVSVRIQPDGKFQAVGVAPGRYSIIARLTEARPALPPPAPGAPPAPPPPAPGPTLFASQDVHVNGEDVTGLVLTLAPTSTISGRVVLENGAAPLPSGATLRASLEMVGTPRPGASPRAVTVDKSGVFSIPSITPGLYRLSGSIQINSPTAPPFMVRTAMLDGRDVYDQSFEVFVGRNHQDAVITLTDRVPELTGTITDASGNPVAGLNILLFPTDRAAWSTSSRRMRGPVRTQPDGTYRISGIRPGEYHLGVVLSLEPGDWGDPAFMEQVAAASLKLVFAEGEKKVQNLRTGG